MQSLGTIVTPPHPCSYLPDRTATIRYDFLAEVAPAEYERLMHSNWRRFGYSIFRPECDGCTMCRSIRVDVAKFAPSQSQKRAGKANRADVTLTVGEPGVSDEKLELYDRYLALSPGGDTTVTKWVADLKNRKGDQVMLSKKEHE